MVINDLFNSLIFSKFGGNNEVFGWEISCYDFMERIIKTCRVNSLDPIILVSELSNSTYFFTIKSGNKLYKTKFVKKWSL